MQLFGWFKKKKENIILNPEDIAELKNMQREAYMEEARKLVKEKGKNEAKISIKIPQEEL